MSDTTPAETAPPAAPSNAPAPPESDLDKTLNLLATAVASISNRVDAQTKVLAQVNETATEARFAAFEAQKQTDPEHYGEVIIENIGDRVGEIVGHLSRAANHNQAVLARAAEDQSALQRDVWEREQRIERLEKRLPWFALGAVVLIIALSVALPRLLASNGTTCGVMGGVWQNASSGGEVCVFYIE